MPLITLMNAHAAWGDLPLLDDADLSIEPGERVGLIGRNGTGKSTLLSILAGHTHLDDGELRVQDGLRVLYVEQEPSCLRQPMSRKASVLRGKLDKIEDEREHWRRLAKLDECLMKFELDPERSVARVSGGERKRAALALAFALEPDLLLLDEPTNHLDIVAITTLENLVNAEFAPSARLSSSLTTVSSSTTSRAASSSLTEASSAPIPAVFRIRKPQAGRASGRRAGQPPLRQVLGSGGSLDPQGHRSPPHPQ